MPSRSQWPASAGREVAGDSPVGPPNPTWRDIKQLIWGVMLLYPFIAIGAYAARGLLGSRTAFWVGFGLAAFVTVCFALIVVASLLVSVAIDGAAWLRRSKGARAASRETGSCP